MPVPSRLTGRFSPERLYAPRSIAVCGSETNEGRRVLANLRSAGFAGQVIEAASDPGSLTEPPDLAILACAPEHGAAILRTLGRLGTRAAIAITPVQGLKALTQETGVRVLGPSSFGLCVPRLRINASMSHMPVPPGTVALLTQSPSLARGVVDWAGPNGVGFSHISGVGGNVDLGFGTGLDWLSRDPDTRLILLDIRRIKDRRAFISAARAASRLRPVVAIRPGGHLLDPSGRADAVLEAAFSRAGVFVVKHLDELLAAAETLSRAKPARGEALVIVTNAIGPGRLAADAALSAGIRLAAIPPEAQSALSASLPADLVSGLVYAGSAASGRVAEMAAMLGAVREVGGVLVILAPTGEGDAVTVESVIAAAGVSTLPVLSCVMGETTGAVHRRRLAEAGLPAFATPEQAVQAFAHLLRNRRAKAEMRELPGRQVLEVAQDRTIAAHVIGRAREEGRLELSRDEAAAILAAYGIAIGEQGAADAVVSIAVDDDPVFGPAIGLSVAGAQPRYGLPPLNLSLAESLAREAGLAGASLAGVAPVLVRVSQLLVDEPAIATLRAGSIALCGERATCLGAAITLRPGGDAAYLAISPYPEHLIEHWRARDGRGFVIRPIRPEDAEAHAAMVRRIPQEDMRYRFFSAMREVSAEQMARLTQIDYDREMAFIAVRDTDGATVGVSRLVRELNNPRGEFAVVVQPDVKGIGLAGHLMEKLFAWGRSVGLAEIAGTVLSDNHPMIAFVRRLGFSVHYLPDEPDVVDIVRAL